MKISLYALIIATYLQSLSYCSELFKISHFLLLHLIIVRSWRVEADENPVTLIKAERPIFMKYLLYKCTRAAAHVVYKNMKKRKKKF